MALGSEMDDIVHSVQTLLVVLLGIYAWIALAFTGKVSPSSEYSTTDKAEQEKLLAEYPESYHHISFKNIRLDYQVLSLGL